MTGVVVLAIVFWAAFTILIRLVEGRWEPHWPLSMLRDIVKP